MFSERACSQTFLWASSTFCSCLTYPGSHERMQNGGRASAQTSHSTAYSSSQFLRLRPGRNSVSHRHSSSSAKHCCLLLLPWVPRLRSGRRSRLEPSCAFLPDFLPQLNPRDFRTAADAVYSAAQTLNSVMPQPLRPAVDLLGSDLASTVALRPSRETLIRLLVHMLTNPCILRLASDKILQ